MYTVEQIKDIISTAFDQITQEEAAPYRAINCFYKSDSDELDDRRLLILDIEGRDVLNVELSQYEVFITQCRDLNIQEVTIAIDQSLLVKALSHVILPDLSRLYAYEVNRQSIPLDVFEICMMRSQCRLRVYHAIENTKKVDLDYWHRTVLQRIPGPTAVGSVLTPWWTSDTDSTLDHQRDIERIEQTLIGDLDVPIWYNYVEHPNVAEGCTLLIGHGLRGQIGVIALDQLPSDTPIVLDDRKNTGKVSATVKGVLGDTVDFFSVILGPEQGQEIVYTFHPGWPVKASQVQLEPGMHGQTVSVADALTMGLTTAKIV